MASFLESITQSFTPDLLGPLGKAVGLDSPSTLKGLEVAGPLLTSALASKGSPRRYCKVQCELGK